MSTAALVENAAPTHQRAFIITALQYLSESAVEEEDAPTMFLAIEEPELYQHPVRARHFASVLDRLASRETAEVQVLYATHSPYFVNARRFESVRVLRRPQDAEERLAAPVISQSRLAQVAERLDGVVAADQIERRLIRSIDFNPGFSEAFFASGVLLVEGPTDASAIRAVASEIGVSLEAEGIVVSFASKTGLPVALAVLQLLKIPVFVMFDGDSGAREDQRGSHERLNVALQQMCGIDPPEPFPGTRVHPACAIFEHNLEAYLREVIEDFDTRCEAHSAGRDWRTKSPETYASVIRDLDAQPQFLQEIVQAACRLTSADVRAC